MCLKIAWLCLGCKEMPLEGTFAGPWLVPCRKWRLEHGEDDAGGPSVCKALHQLTLPIPRSRLGTFFCTSPTSTNCPFRKGKSAEDTGCLVSAAIQLDRPDDGGKAGDTLGRFLDLERVLEVLDHRREKTKQATATTEPPRYHLRSQDITTSKGNKRRAVDGLQDDSDLGSEHSCITAASGRAKQTRSGKATTEKRSSGQRWTDEQDRLLLELVEAKYSYQEIVTKCFPERTTASVQGRHRMLSASMRESQAKAAR